MPWEHPAKMEEKLGASKEEDLTDKWKIAFWLMEPFYHSELSLGNMRVIYWFLFTKIDTVLFITFGGCLCTWSACLYLESKDVIMVQNDRGRRGDIYAPSLYFWVLERVFILHCSWTSSNIIRVTSELYQKERPLNSALWQVNCYLWLPSEMLRNTVPGTQLVCLSGSISDRSFVFLSPIRLKPACNDKLSVSDLSIRNISLKVCSDSHGCFILTNLVVLGFFWWNWNKEDPEWCVSGRKEAYC